MLKRFILPAIFVIIAALLYRYIIFVPGQYVDQIMFLSIILCFAFGLLNTRKDNFLRTLALACTVGADYYLVYCTPRQELNGMLFFLAVQTFYAAYLFVSGRKKLWLFVRVGLVAAIEVVTYIVLGSKMDPLAAVSVAYYAIMLVNILEAFTQIKKDILFPIGLLLFVLCDSVIGLQVAAKGYLPIPADSALYQLIFSNFNLPWLFYLPSQVLIALSQRKRR